MDRRIAGVEQGETTGAVGGLHHAGLEAALPNCCGLLIARDAKNADRAAEQISRAEVAGAVTHLWEQGLLHTEDLAQLRVPVPLCDVEEERARRIGGIGRVHLAAGEPPEKE